MTSVVKTEHFLTANIRSLRCYGIHFQCIRFTRNSKNSDSSGRRMWQQTSLASMSCWAWELRGVVANCAWKRCCLGEKGKGWSTCRNRSKESKVCSITVLLVLLNTFMPSCWQVLNQIGLNTKAIGFGHTRLWNFISFSFMSVHDLVT